MPKIQCKQCGVWLKHKHSFRVHMKIHEDSDKEHICNVCGRRAPNKLALKNHINYSHVREKSHKCNLCEKAFKRPLSLKEHMATHTGDILYTCSYCPKTFNSNANKHAHIKKLHKNEWLESKLNQNKVQ